MFELWFPHPIYEVLLDVLQRKQGSLMDVELYDALKEHYPDLSFLTFNKTLMKLELQGIIHVYNVTKNKRGVELIKG